MVEIELNATDIVITIDNKNRSILFVNLHSIIRSLLLLFDYFVVVVAVLVSSNLIEFFFFCMCLLLSYKMKIEKRELERISANLN